LESRSTDTSKNVNRDYDLRNSLDGGELGCDRVFEGRVRVGVRDDCSKIYPLDARVLERTIEYRELSDALDAGRSRECPVFRPLFCWTHGTIVDC
jgi:hypothetical protein